VTVGAAVGVAIAAGRLVGSEVGATLGTGVAVGLSATAAPAKTHENHQPNSKKTVESRVLFESTCWGPLGQSRQGSLEGADALLDFINYAVWR
jgi:hypothetical protein